MGLTLKGLLRFLGLERTSTPTSQHSYNMPSFRNDARSEARNRLKLVLMHDRTQISSGTMEQLRDELVEVISKYVEIDKNALELNLEGESNTIALVANIPVLRAKTTDPTVKA